jgi:hypothetical protein
VKDIKIRVSVPDPAIPGNVLYTDARIDGMRHDVERVAGQLYLTTMREYRNRKDEQSRVKTPRPLQHIVNESL